jgi:AI-2 transport protein TqsA
MIQMVIGNVIEPKWMGEGLNLHPITVLLALSFWGLLWGMTGVFLGVPLTAIIRIILVQFDTLRPIGNLLAGELPGSQEHSP